MAFRLVALDLDGTALDKQGAPRPATIAAVERLTAQGIEVLVVTGRHHMTARPHHAAFGLKTPAICCNGAYLYDFSADRTVSGVALSKDEARGLIEIASEYGSHATLYTDRAMLYSEMEPGIERLLAWSARQQPAHRAEIRKVDSLETAIDDAETVWKVLLTQPDRERLEACQTTMQARFDLSYERSWVDRLDIVQAGATKGSRLGDWLKRRAIDPSEVIAFGDNINDITMLRLVGLGIAMGNAEDEVKAAADLVAGANDTDTIAETLARYIA